MKLEAQLQIWEKKKKKKSEEFAAVRTRQPEVTVSLVCCHVSREKNPFWGKFTWQMTVLQM